MSEPSRRNVVVLTNDVREYAVIAAAHQALAGHLGVEFCWPVIQSERHDWSTDALRTRYNVATTRLEDIVAGCTPRERQQALTDRLRSFDGGKPPIAAPPELLLSALVRALASNRFLTITDSATMPQREADVSGGGADDAGLVVACRRSAFAVPAAVFAHATGRSVLFVDRFDDLDSVQAAQCAAASGSVVFVDEIQTFTKRFLETLLRWSETGPRAPVPFGVMTGPSVEWLSSVICRLLLHRKLRRSGEHLQEPHDLEPIPVLQMPPLEYYVLGAHGNEMHLLHQGEEVLCGASADRFVAAGGFDCEPRCPYAARVSASMIPANAVLLLSCDAFTLGDGLVPAGYNVLLNLLSGWTSSVVAPYKHFQLSPALMILVDALIRSGFSMAEIALRLNSIARFGHSPDAGYLVWGDPDLVPAPVPARRPVPFSIERREALEISFVGNGSRVAEIPIPESMLAEILDNGCLPAVEPLSEELKDLDFYFAFAAVPARKEVELILFGKRPLGTDRLCIGLRRAVALPASARERASDAVRRISQLAAIGVPWEVMHTAEQNVLATLRGAAGYPRPAELLLGDTIAWNISRILEMKYRESRRLLLDGLLKVMEESRLWLSHHYSSVYDCVDLVEPAGPNLCPFCANNTVTWRYDDNVSGYASRHLVICSRCGIIADAPTAAEVAIRLKPHKLFVQTREHQVVALRNLTAAPLELTWCAQFNQWKRLGMKVEPIMEDVMLPPGAEIECVVEFDVAPSLHDDVIHMHVFALTETFSLHFAGQKVVAIVRPDAPDIREESRAHVEACS